MDVKFDQRSYDIILAVDGENNVDLDFVSTPDEDLMQRLYLRFKTYPKDLFWNVNYGIDYLNTIFGKSRPIGTVDIIMRDEILKEPLVDKIISFESEISNYSYACKFSVSVVDEDVEVTYFILTNENGVILTNQDGDTLTSRL